MKNILFWEFDLKTDDFFLEQILGVPFHSLEKHQAFL